MGRSAAELQAAAEATGWFSGPNLQYIGDGYTIPWQSGVPTSLVFPVGPLAAWKVYLDTRFPQGAHLHDWLYTPYGQQIGATQEESDDAIRELMLAEGATAAEAFVVWAACRVGGGPWFGTSSVGYVDPLLGPSGINMALAPASRGGVMADWKVVIVFQQTSTAGGSQASIGYSSIARTGGWTESHWHANSDVAMVKARLVGPRTDTSASPILPARALCLPEGGSIIGYRLYERGGGRGQFVAAAYPGATYAKDVPSMSLLCQSLNPATPSVRRFTMRGIPDTQISGGEFNPSDAYTTAIRTYFGSLFNTSFRGRTAQSSVAIFEIGATGILKARASLAAYPVKSIIKITGALDAGGRKRSGEYVIETVSSDTEVILRGWQWGSCEGGKVSAPLMAFFSIPFDTTSVVRVANHKVGRGFVGYRGRSSKRSR